MSQQSEEAEERCSVSGSPPHHLSDQVKNGFPSHDSKVGAQDLPSLMSFPKPSVRGARALRAAGLKALATAICHIWLTSNLISCLSESVIDQENKFRCSVANWETS